MPPVTTRPLTGRMGWVKERGNPPRRGLSVAARTMQTEETPKRKRSSRPPRFLRPFRIRQAGKPVPRQRNETICCRLCPNKKLGQARAGRDRQKQAGQAETGGTPKRKHSCRPPRFLRPFCIQQAGKPVPGITRNYRSVGFRHDLWPGLAAFALLHRHDIKPPTGRPLGAENRPYVVVPLPVQLP